MKLRRILVPVDFSSCSQRALQIAIELAGPLQATIDVLHVWHEPYLVAPDLLISLPNRPQMSVQDWVLSEAQSQMDAVIKNLKPPSNVPISSRLEEGVPFETILRVSKEGYDMIVMGTLGRTGISRVFMGSVAEKVVRASPIPVLTVRQEEVPGAA